MENLSPLREVWPSCTCAAVFLLLLLWDVYRALKRRAHWAPGQALVLSALTIQMLSLIDYSHISYVGSENKKYQSLFDCTRLMMCVFIAYLLPSMVRSNWTSVWSDMGGLILSVILRMTLEVYFVWKLYWIPSQSVWFIVSNTTLCTATLMLVFLLSCAVLAGKSIRYMLSLKIHWALSCCSDSPSVGERKNSCSSNSPGECKNWCCSQNFEKCENTECKNSGCSNSHREFKNRCSSQNLENCENTEDHVLKCWIVARVSHPEYIMARSVFSSLAGVVVTIAVVILGVKWACLHHLPLEYGIAHRTTVCIEFAFILVGWIVVSFRWLTAVLYFPRNAEFLLYLEDFWTMSIVDLKAVWDSHLRRKKLAKESQYKWFKEKKISEERPLQTVIVTLITAVRLHSILLPMRVWLQKLMVRLSKACWGLSQKLMGMIRPFIINTQKRLLYGSYRSGEAAQFRKYKKTLEFIRMPGESADNLWIANEMAFKMTEAKMEKGIENGKVDSPKLVKLIKQRKPASSPELKNEDENYFNGIMQMSWKGRAVSLMYCMMHSYEDSIDFDVINDATRDNIINGGIKDDVVNAYKKATVINDAMEACSDAWDLLDFVDSSDNVGLDIEFDDLRNMWQKHFGNLEKLKGALEQLQMEENATCGLEDWHGSKDWMRLTVHCNLYKRLYMKFHSIAEISQEYHYLRSILAYVIHDCLENEVKKVLIEKCNKWAEDSNEQEIYLAAFIAGKAKGLRDKIAEDEAKEKDQGQPDNIAEDVQARGNSSSCILDIP